jgi:hypothetical protein
LAIKAACGRKVPDRQKSTVIMGFRQTGRLSSLIASIHSLGIDESIATPSHTLPSTPSPMSSRQVRRV